MRSLQKCPTRTKNLNRTRSWCLDTKILMSIRPWLSFQAWTRQMSSTNAQRALLVTIQTSMVALLALDRSLHRQRSIELMQPRVLTVKMTMSVAEPRPSPGRKRRVNRLPRAERLCQSLAIKSDYRCSKRKIYRTQWPGSSSKTSNSQTLLNIAKHKKT